MTGTLVEVFFVGVLAGMSPGPDFVLVTRNSLAYGGGVGRATALGIALGLTIHVSYAILGFALLLSQMPLVFKGVQLCGALYLAYLGLQALGSRQRDSEDEGAVGVSGPSADRSRAAGFRDGLICNVTNPKAALFFLGVFSQFLTPGAPAFLPWIYGLEIMLAVGGWFLLLATTVSSRRFRAVYRRGGHWIDRALGVLLLSFSVRIAVTLLR